MPNVSFFFPMAYVWLASVMSFMYGWSNKATLTKVSFQHDDDDVDDNDAAVIVSGNWFQFFNFYWIVILSERFAATKHFVQFHQEMRKIGANVYCRQSQGKK